MSIKEKGCPFEHTSICFAPSVKERHHLIVTFQLPPLLQHYDCKADEYISHLVGHEGPGSLLSELKARNWATSLCAGVTWLACFVQLGCHIIIWTLTCGLAC
jgi:secreted Zn-dependent insulinase-like peptidase